MKRQIRSFLAGVFIGSFFVSSAHYAREFAFAQTQPPSDVSSEVARLKEGIADRNNRLKQIEAEIAQYQQELQKVGGEKATLQNAIRQLELERKKVQSDLSYTQNKIGATDLEIQKLDLEIEETGGRIDRNRLAVEEMVRRMHEQDNLSLVEVLLIHDNLSEAWAALDGMAQVRAVMDERMRDLTDLQNILEEKVTEHHAKRGDLVALKDQYSGQQKVLDVNRSEKSQLLAQTRNQEASYQSLLAEKQAAKAQFEKELRELEAKLQFTLDPASIPTAGTTALSWPLDSIRITQEFGNTAFARTAAYNGSGHNGVDFGIPRGTPVRAALSGNVLAVNTQVAPMCQYGKWIVIRHANGLTTLYAHLSVVNVNQGAAVSTGDVIGYSGDTGYATGPHLHFTVYASDAVTFKQYTCNSGVTLTIPIAAYTGYLNPLLYLPPL
ncbi:peptidoglycan DD-metalloendopeptidase family protein [Candidatus Kaiserbacteria bacterium]|nr:peptidoglycan DD-metalloendopeptidase family protein [Candidatus Kaiserbacteria bacterium]